MSDRDNALTADDIHDLNRESVERASAFVRIAGSILVVVGTVGALAWLWSAVRVQQQASSAAAFGLSRSSGNDVSWIDRVDLFAPYVGNLVLAASAVGFGLFLRLLADFLVDRVGGTTTAFVEGDELDGLDQDLPAIDDGHA